MTRINLKQYIIECSDYNVNIDNTVTVTVTCLDPFGDPVVAEPISIEYDGTEIATGVTNNNGQFSTTHQCTEWGLHMFSTNNKSIQINVTGLKLIASSSSSSSFGGDYKLFVDEANRTAVAKLEINNKNIGTGATNYQFVNFVPEKYRPNSSKYSFGDRYLDVIFYIFSNGTIGVSNIKGTTMSNASVACEMSWSW